MALEAVAQADVLVGGKRHLEQFPDLRANAVRWMPTSPD
jgi:precorrin-6B methylase 1